MEKVLNREFFFHPIPNEMKNGEKLTYEILQLHKREQQRLISEGIFDNPKITDDVFTPEQEVEFSRGRSVEEVFNNISEKYGF